MARPHCASAGVASLLCALAAAACGTEDPPEKLVADEFFPLGVGSRWEYVEEKGAESERHFKSITGCAPDLAFRSDCDDALETIVDAFVQTSIGDSDAAESGITYLTVERDGVYRVRQERKDMDEPEPEVVRTYWPGFFRFPRGVLAPGRAWTAEHDACELDTTGSEPDPAPALEHDAYRWTIESVGPLDLGEAGTFRRTVELRRENTGSGRVKLFWFAEGVGKVLEREMQGQTVVSEERIVSWQIVDEPCPF